MVYGRRAWHGAHIKQNAHVRLEDGAKRIEEPAMRVDLLLVLLFETENDLHRNNTLLMIFHLERWRDRDCGSSMKKNMRKKKKKKGLTLRSVFVNVGRDGLAIDDVFRHAILVDSHARNDAERPAVDLRTSITHDAHDHLLPSILSPSLASIPLAQMSDVFHDTVHGSAEELLVFVVHGHDDEEFGAARRVIMDLAEGET
jgi:hypothetical protein